MQPYDAFVAPDALMAAVRSLHDSPTMTVLVATGAGAGLQNLLWQAGGSSRTIIEAQFPYAHAALAEFLGSPEPRTAHARVALRMADEAYARALLLQHTGAGNGMPLSAEPAPLVGLGITGAVATDHTRHGHDRFHVAVRTADGFRRARGIFPRDALSRAEQGAVIDLVGLRGLLAAARLSDLPVAQPIAAVPFRTVTLDNPTSYVRFIDMDP